MEELCRRFGSERVVVALDARDGLVATHGWTETSEITATELAGRMADLGVVRLLYTDISRDGTLEEPNYAATAALVRGQRVGRAVGRRRRRGGTRGAAGSHGRGGGNHRAGALYGGYYDWGGFGGGGVAFHLVMVRLLCMRRDCNIQLSNSRVC